MPNPAGITYIAFGAYNVITAVGTTMDAVQQSKGLGTAMVDFSNHRGMIFGVFVNKVGTGTQAWQLYNQTLGVGIGTITDAGATGAKWLSTTWTTGLPTGETIVRVRAASTAGSDSPVYYGGFMKLW